jgi:hypothetical protein
MQWLEYPFWPKGPSLNFFFKIYFSFTNKMDENKLSFNRFFKLIVQKKNLQR